MLIIGILSIVFIIYKSLQWIWDSHYIQEKKLRYLSLENFLLFLFTYVILFIGFGFIYTLFELAGVSVLVEGGKQIEVPFFNIVGTGMYFSAVTLFSVGYGEVVPIGIGRWIAILEAMIGYILPAAFVLRSVIDFEDSFFKKT